MKIVYTTALIGLLAIVATPATAQTLRYGNFEPPGVVSNVEMAEFFKELSAETKGSLGGQIFPGGQLLGPAATLKGIGDRVVDGGFVVSSLAIGALPATNIPIDLMFHVKDPMVSAAAALDTVLLNCENCRKEAKAANVEWLGGFAPSPWYLMCRPPIKSSEELRGRKIRVTGASATRLAAAMGAVAVQLPPTEIGAAIQGGQIDCAVGPLPWLKDYGLTSTVKTVVDSPLGIANALGLFIFNRATYERLTAEQRAALLKLIPVSAVRGTRRYMDSHQEVRREAEKQGVAFWKPDQRFNDIMKKFVDNEVPNVTADLKKRGIADPESLIKTHLANIDKWQKRINGMGGDQKKLSDALRTEVFSKVIK